MSHASAGYPRREAEFREYLQHVQQSLPSNPNLDAWIDAASTLMSEINDEIKAHPRSKSDFYIKHPRLWDDA